MIFLDTFSGAAAYLKRGQRTSDNVLAALRRDPRISTWDMSEHPWLCRCIKDLIQDGLIIEDKNEPYPWHRFIIKETK